MLLRNGYNDKEIRRAFQIQLRESSNKCAEKSEVDPTNSCGDVYLGETAVLSKQPAKFQNYFPKTEIYKSKNNFNRDAMSLESCFK